MIGEEKKIKTELENESAQKTSSGLMQFLNSRFGIWLLGFLFLSTLPFIIKIARLSYDEEKSKLMQEEMLHVEIGHRLRHIVAIAQPISHVQLNDALFAFYGLDDSLVSERHWRYYNFKPIYTEYEKMPFRNLVIQYAALQSDITTKSETMKLAHLLDAMKHKYLIVDFKEVLVEIKNKPYYDLRLFSKDTTELKVKYIKPVVEWSSKIE
jgi:hypothetical protein